MLDHLHMIWRLPAADADCPTRIRLIKTAFAKDLAASSRTKGSESRASKGERDVWQRRFWEHTIRNEQELASCVSYVHGNPVKHGHAASISDWPYSTYVGWRPGGPER